MAEGTSSGQNILDMVGLYNPVEREREVEGKMRQAFEEIRRENIHEKVLSGHYENKNSWSWGGSKKKEVQDVITIMLNSICDEIQSLEKKVAEFKGPCFSREHRTLHGDGEKLVKDLDDLDVCLAGRTELMEKKRKAITKIQEELFTALARKTHPGGKSCPKCDIQN